MNATSDIVFVTGASQNHFNSLLQCIGTIDRTYCCTYVYDLGLNKESIEQLKSIDNIILKTFDYPTKLHNIQPISCIASP